MQDQEGFDNINFLKIMIETIQNYAESCYFLNIFKNN